MAEYEAEPLTTPIPSKRARTPTPVGESMFPLDAWLESMGLGLLEGVLFLMIGVSTIIGLILVLGATPMRRR